VTSAKPADKTGAGKVQGYRIEMILTAELKK
jgi:hypothetical protein